MNTATILPDISINQVFEDSLASVYKALTALTTIHDNKGFLNPDSPEYKQAVANFLEKSNRHFQVKQLIAEAVTCHEESKATVEPWKVVKTDNLNREIRSDTIYRSGLSKQQAEDLAGLMNRALSEGSEDYYITRLESEEDFIFNP